MPKKPKQETMRAAVYYNNQDIRIEEMPIPKIGDDELLVRIESSGICGSDVMEWYRLAKAPLVLGHEIAGTVAKAGKKVKPLQGRRSRHRRAPRSVQHVPLLPRRAVLPLRHAPLDELRSGRLLRIRARAGDQRRPRHVPRFPTRSRSTRARSSSRSPASCAASASRGSGRARASSFSGAEYRGFSSSRRSARSARARSSRPTSTTHRLAAAKRFGADAALAAKDATPQKLASLNDGRLFDLVVTSAGAASVVEQAFRSVDRGGTVLLFAPHEPGTTVPLPLSEIWRDQITIVATYAAPPVDTARAIEILRAHRIEVNDMITHRLPLEETARGFRLVAEGKKSIKVIIRPQE